MVQQKRLQGIDLLKCIAIICIPAQHFFTLNTHFREAEFDTLSMFIQGVAMEIALIGVPLFIAITGYLSQQTEPTWNYYRKILRVLVPYIIISLVYIYIRINCFDEAIGFVDGVNMILGFNAITYAWYIEMWIGLYLLAPFLNILFSNIKTATTSYILIATLFGMTYMTATVNREGFHFLPDYWVKISPLTAYFIGCHIRKFGISISRNYLLLFILVAILAEPIMNLLLFQGQPYRFIFGTYLLIVPVMAAVFALLYRWKTDNGFLNKALTLISDNTLEMYLYCALCDMVLYPLFMKWYISQNQFGLFFFIIIPLELIATFCMSWITHLLLKISRIDRLWKVSKLKEI